jgi:acyl-CoA hydrolase
VTNSNDFSSEPRGELTVRIIAMPADTGVERAEGRVVTDAVFTFVAVDDEGRPRSIPRVSLWARRP